MITARPLNDSAAQRAAPSARRRLAAGRTGIQAGVSDAASCIRRSNGSGVTGSLVEFGAARRGVSSSRKTPGAATAHQAARA